MSFDLNVEFDSLPDDLKTRWAATFRSEGFEVEICPGFDPASWEGGFLPMRVTVAPETLVGVSLPAAAIGGFEVSFDEPDAFDGGNKRCAHFRFGWGGPSLEFAMLCIGAALLAQLTNGTYVDPQSGEEHDRDACLAAAKTSVREFLHQQRAVSLEVHSFSSWEDLGVQV